MILKKKETIAEFLSNVQYNFLQKVYLLGTITYDSLGNPLTYNNGTAYTFTWEGRQMQTATKGGKTWSYTYNSDGLRTSKTNGSTIYSYTWNENRQLSTMVCGTSSAWFYYDHEGKPLYMEYVDGNDECSGSYRYILNLQGDVVGLYDLTRDCMAMTYTYDAWGRELSWSTLNSGYAGLIFNNPLTYRGYIYDRETGFYYLQSRYYDSTVGRFLNADDTNYLGISGTVIGWNLFSYCYNDPINYTDRFGYSSLVGELQLPPDFLNILGAALNGIMASVLGSISSIKAAIASSWFVPLCIVATLTAVAGISYVIYKTVKMYAMAMETLRIVNQTVRVNGINEDKLSGYSVYLIYKNSDKTIYYVGMTKNFANRKYKHQKSSGCRYPISTYTMIAVKTNLSRAEARVLEQTLLTAFTLEALNNVINSISPKKWKYFKNEFARMQALISSWFDPE